MGGVVTAPAPDAAPVMIAVPAGSFLRGREESPRRDETPVHRVTLRAFRMDQTLVTRTAFARFVAATGYRTTAERVGYAMASREGMEDWSWERVLGASWRRPALPPASPALSPPSAPGAKPDADEAAFLADDAPVVMVSHDDARAYCAWRGARLPTEAEWEYAMRAGRDGSRYPWGDEPRRDGRYGLNFWQGASHRRNLRRDGFVYVSPVRAFPPNAWGLYDPVGNVWQWTADWYAPDTYRRAQAQGGVVDPVGPASGERRVVRGGSWWCGACTCEGNGLFYRGKSAPRAAFNNLGFRCAQDLR